MIDQRESRPVEPAGTREKRVHGSIARSIGLLQLGALRAYDLLELLSGEDTASFRYYLTEDR